MQAKINSRVVRRTVGLLHDKGQAEALGYHPRFAYSETQHAEDEVAARRVSFFLKNCMLMSMSLVWLRSYLAASRYFHYFSAYRGSGILAIRLFATPGVLGCSSDAKGWQAVARSETQHGEQGLLATTRGGLCVERSCT